MASADWNILRFTESELDAFEHYYSLDWQHTGERYRISIDGDFTIRTTLTAEIEDTGVLQNINREQWQVAPIWEYQLTPTHKLQLNYYFQNTTYERKKNVFSFTDFNYHSASAAWLYQWNELTEFSLSFFASRYEPIDLPQKSDTLGVQAGLRYAFSETLSGGIMAGYRQTFSETEQIICRQAIGQICLVADKETVNETDSGFVASANLDKLYENGSWSISLMRQLQPLGFGGLSERTEGRAIFRYKPRERWQTRLNLYASRLETTGGSTANNERDYYAVTPALRWLWTKEISLELSYTYRYQKFKSNNKAADGNIVALQFFYQPLKKR